MSQDCVTSVWFQYPCLVWYCESGKVDINALIKLHAYILDNLSAYWKLCEDALNV